MSLLPWSKGENSRRRTAAKESYRLILHPKDKDEAVFILLTGKAPTFTAKGWIYGKKGKLEKYWTDPKTGRPAFFIPQKDLNPIGTLKAMLSSVSVAA